MPAAGKNAAGRAPLRDKRMELSELYESFFEEADELLEDMERLLLALDPEQPDLEDLNAIFRAAHSIKGGAGAFGFSVLQETTHILENLLDDSRRGELQLSNRIIDTFLETKDMLRDQLDAYRQEAEPDPEAFEQICRKLQDIARELGDAPLPDAGLGNTAEQDAESGTQSAAEAAPPAEEPDTAQPAAADSAATTETEPEAETAAAATDDGARALEVVFTGVDARDRELLLDELKVLGEIQATGGDDKRFSVTLLTDVDVDDIEAVMYFVLEPDQLQVLTPGAAVGGQEAGESLAGPGSGSDPSQSTTVADDAGGDEDIDEDDLDALFEAHMTGPGAPEPATAEAGQSAAASGSASMVEGPAAPAQADTSPATAAAVADATVADTSGSQGGAGAPTAPPSETTASPAAAGTGNAAADRKAAPVARRNAGKAAGGKSGAESATIRVPVDKVDQIINLVGELIITHSMLAQSASEIDPAEQSAVHYGINLLQRNARDLQEAVMSIRMVPMDYVFSRFPRLVRDTSSKLGKQIDLVTEGKSTELDKGLIERIIDPLTHLVRNSMDHGIEMPDAREAAGKAARGTLTLSAKHQGGNIVIEVSDDGAGLNRDKLLAKARSNGMDVSDGMTDDEVWQLIFAPGFSTAEQVSDISGRGVGMDVVKRNIQSMGGHVEIESRAGNGTTTRIVLPLTLAILDGMSVRVGEEIFILPLSVVRALMQPSESELYTIAGEDQVLKVRDEYLPVISLGEAMGVESTCQSTTEAIAVLVETEGVRFALLIDEPVGQQQVVVKNLETNYRKVPGVSAATILGDGRVALIVDVADLQRRSGARRKAGRARQRAQQVDLEDAPA